MSDLLIGEPLGPRVKTVIPMQDYKLDITFTNGERRTFDVKPLLALPVFKPLENADFFRSVKVAYGTIIWPNGIDYCPDTLYSESRATGGYHGVRGG
jgi:hypothetical protein